MDQGPLVTNQFLEGRELLRRLAATGMDVKAAFWARSIESKLWVLYLVSEDVEKNGVAATYRAVADTLHQVSDIGLSLSEITVIGVKNPLYTAFIGPSQLRGGVVGHRLPVSHSDEFDEVYIYPPLPRPSPPPPVRTKVLTLSTIAKGATMEDVVDEIGFIDAVIGEDEFNSRLVKLLEARYGSLEQFQASSPRILLEAVH